MNVSPKSRTTAFILSCFLGTFGIHQFYVGNVRKGVTMLILSILLITLIVSAIMNLVDWIEILSGKFKDGEGRTVSTW